MTTEFMPTTKSQPKPVNRSITRTKTIQSWQYCGLALVCLARLLFRSFACVLDEHEFACLLVVCKQNAEKNCDCKHKSSSFSQLGLFRWIPFPSWFYSIFQLSNAITKSIVEHWRTLNLLCKCALIVCYSLQSASNLWIFGSRFSFGEKKTQTHTERGPDNCNYYYRISYRMKYIFLLDI